MILPFPKTENVDHEFSKSNIESKQSTNVSFYIKYFEYWGFFGTIPFRLQICEGTRKCIVHKTIFRTVLFGLIIVLTLCESIRWIHDVKSCQYSEINYFYKAEVWGFIFILFCFAFVMNKKTKEFEDLINYCITSFNYDSKCLKWTKNIPLLLFLCFNVLLNQISNVSSLIITYKWEHSQKYITNKMLKEFSEHFHINLDDGTIGLLSFVSLTVICIPSFLFKSSWETLLSLTAVLLHIHLNNIEVKLQGMSLEQGYVEYNNLRSFFKLSNKALEILMFSFVFGSIPTIFNSLPRILQPKTLIEFVERFTACYVQILFLVYGSWLNTKSKEIFAEWLFRKNTNIQSLNVQFKYFHQFSKENQLGFSAFGFIKFSSGLLSAITVFVFTISVVYIQFQPH